MDELLWIGLGAALTAGVIGGFGLLMVGPFEALGFLREGDRIVRKEQEEMSKRLMHDTAFACAAALVEVVSPALREEEQIEAHEAFYHGIRAALERYEQLKAQEAARLKPTGG